MWVAELNKRTTKCTQAISKCTRAACKRSRDFREKNCVQTVSLAFYSDVMVLENNGRGIQEQILVWYLPEMCTSLDIICSTVLL